MKIFMARATALTALLMSLLASSLIARVPDDPANKPKAYIIPGRVTVVFNDNVDLSKARVGFGSANFNLPSLDNVLRQFQVSESRRIFTGLEKSPRKNLAVKVPDLSRFYELAFPDSIPVETVIASLQQNPNVRVAEAVWALPLYAAPNDAQYISQWSMKSPGPDPNFYTAWDVETGSDSIKYAAIDSGVKYGHADLAGNIWVNPGEDMDGDQVVYDADDLNGIDDDGNGWTDDLIGYDFLTSLAVIAGEDGGSPDPNPDDFDGHGTHISGIAAASTNNSINVAGIAGGWYGGHRAKRGVRIMCLRVGGTGTDGNGYVNSNDCGTAIQYAVNNGADVINCSWGSSFTTTMDSAMSLVATFGLTICHAAGNDDLNSGSGDFLDQQASVLTVASVGPSSDIKSGFSNYGYAIDVSAPGSDIFNTWSNDGTATTASLSGTSMAAPAVCGLALLLRSAKPSLTKNQVDSIIINTADNIDGVNLPEYTGLLGSGRINAATALAGLPIAKFTPDKTAGNLPLTVNFTDLTPGSPSTWDWTFGDAGTSTLQNPSHLYNAAGVYDVSLLANTGHVLGLAEEHLLDYIWVRADTCKIDSVQAIAGNSVTLPIYLTNTQLVKEIQFSFQLLCTPGIVDSFKWNTTGLRTSYFNSVILNAYDGSSQSYGILMKSSPSSGSTYLTPGNGAILNLILYTNGAALNELVTIDTVTISSKAPRVSTIYGDYWPVFKQGKVNYGGCCVKEGDANHSGSVNVVDVTFLVNYLFKSGPIYSCKDEADANDNGAVNVVDLTYLVNYLFKSGPITPCP